MPPDYTTKLVNRMFDYAVDCKNGLSFNVQESMSIIEEHTPPNIELRKELWAILAMYSFENMVFQVVNKYNTGDPEVAANQCRSTLFECARLYDPEQNTQFNTYAYQAMRNNVRRDNRESNAARDKSTPLIHIPDKLIPVVVCITNHPEKTDQEVAKECKQLVRTVKLVREAMRAQNLVSLDEPFEGDNGNGDGGTLAAVLDSGEDIASDFCNRESENAIMTEFLPIIARIYGNASAYVTLLRTGMIWGYQRTSFYKMEDLYCVYLVTTKRLNTLAEEIPTYKPLCEHLQFLFATGGRRAVEEYIRGTTEEYLIYTLLNDAEKEAHTICTDPNKTANDCYKPAGSLNYMFTKIFPVKPGALSDADKRQAARFRKELRDKGMDQIANALFAAMSKSSD